MSKHTHGLNQIKSLTDLRHKKQHQHSITASHELQIIQNISVDQLRELEKTYTYMLEAIKEARRTKAAAEKKTAEIIKHGADYSVINDRRALKIAWLWEHGKSSKEIDTIMINGNGYSLNRIRASHGRALKRKKIQHAKELLIIKLVNQGHGIRPTARSIPAALGPCSPTLVCKIMKKEKMRQHPNLPFKLCAV